MFRAGGGGGLSFGALAPATESSLRKGVLIYGGVLTTEKYSRHVKK